MKLQYLETKKIKASGTDIADIITNKANYDTITIKGKLNTDIETIVVIAIADILDTTQKFYFVDSDLIITPQFFGKTEFSDGVYYFEGKFNKINNAGWISVSTCCFVDISTKCKLASLLKTFINEMSDVNSEKPITIAHLLHYALVNGSNCGCNCGELVTIYFELKKLLTGTDQQILNDCGC